MRVVGTLVFTFSVLVHSIVCPGYRLDFVRPVAPFDLRPALVEPEDYPDTYIRLDDNGPLTRVIGPMAVLEKGDIIVGRNRAGRLHEIWNADDRVIIRNKATRTTHILTPELARDLDLLRYLSARARAQALELLG